MKSPEEIADKRMYGGETLAWLKTREASDKFLAALQQHYPPEAFQWKEMQKTVSTSP